MLKCSTCIQPHKIKNFELKTLSRYFWCIPMISGRTEVNWFDQIPLKLEAKRSLKRCNSTLICSLGLTNMSIDTKYRVVDLGLHALNTYPWFWRPESSFLKFPKCSKCSKLGITPPLNYLWAWLTARWMQKWNNFDCYGDHWKIRLHKVYEKSPWQISYTIFKKV